MSWWLLWDTGHNVWRWAGPGTHGCRPGRRGSTCGSRASRDHGRTDFAGDGGSRAGDAVLVGKPQRVFPNEVPARGMGGAARVGGRRCLVGFGRDTPARVVEG